MLARKFKCFSKNVLILLLTTIILGLFLILIKEHEINMQMRNFSEMRAIVPLREISQVLDDEALENRVKVKRAKGIVKTALDLPQNDLIVHVQCKAKKISKKIVCDEHHIKRSRNNYELMDLFITDPNCKLSPKLWQQSLTLIGISGDIHPDIKKAFPHFEVLTDNREGSSSSVMAWKRLLEKVKTPYVLILRGINLHGGNGTFNLDYLEFERSIRLLQEDFIGAVGGSLKEIQTGKWSLECKQIKIRNYLLELQPGYRNSVCDCMECPLQEAGPFMTKTELARKYLLKGIVKFKDEMAFFLSFFLNLHNDGRHLSLICPDIMYPVDEKKRNLSKIDLISKPEWKKLSEMFQILGIVLDTSPKIAHKFNCQEVGVSQNVRKTQLEAKLLPWCIAEGHNRIMKVFDELASVLNFHYELNDGSILGGVKISDFMPWDIDGDVLFESRAFESIIKPGGIGMKMFAENNITVKRISNDAYTWKNVGYFVLSQNHGSLSRILGDDGIEIEFVGKKSECLSHCHQQLPMTKTRFANLWLRTHVNPGRYARSAYGPNHLRHAQSWRYSNGEQKGAHDSYKTANGWRRCKDPRDWACLENYSADGNILFHPDFLKVSWVENEN